MRTSRLMLGVLMCILLLTVGCSSFVKDTYRTLAVSKETYTATMNTAGDLYRGGVLGDEQKAEIIKAGNVYLVVHNEAVATLLQYQADEQDATKNAVKGLVKKVSEALVKIIDLIKPYVVEEGGAT